MPNSPTYDPNSVQDYALKNKLVDSWNPKNAAALFEKQGLGTAASYLALGKNNSSQNQALLAKLKGYGGTTGKGISGSGSVSKHLQTTGAVDTAGKSIVPPSPKGVDTTTQPPSPQQIKENPQLKAFETAKNSAYATIDQQYKPQVDALRTDYSSTVAGYQEEKNKAVAGAEAEYARANPYGSGSDKTQFIESISKSYDKMIDQASTAFHEQMSTVTGNIMAAKANVDTQYQQQINDYKVSQGTQFKDYLAGLKISDGTTPPASELFDAIGTAIASGKTFEQAKSEIQGALDYAGRVQKKADLAEQHQQFMEQHLSHMEALTQERLDQADTTSSKNQAKYAADYLTKLRASLSGTRSGDVGIGNLRIANAIKAQQVVNDNTDSSGNINLSKAQYGDLVIAVASLLSSTGNPTNLQETSLTQTSLGSKGKDVYNFLTGQTDTVPSQSVIKNLVSILKSNATAAEETRNTAIGNVFNLANPFLDSGIKSQIDAGFNFNSYTQFLKTGTASQNWITGEPASNGGGGGSSGGGSGGGNTYNGITLPN